MIAVFCRSYHPVSQGNHSYSTLLVEFENEEALAALRAKLASPTGFPEPFGHPHPWYSGPFDYVATVAGPVEHMGHHGGWVPLENAPTRLSMGDNRFVGHYRASDLL